MVEVNGKTLSGCVILSRAEPGDLVPSVVVMVCCSRRRLCPTVGCVVLTVGSLTARRRVVAVGSPMLDSYVQVSGPSYTLVHQRAARRQGFALGVSEMNEGPCVRGCIGHRTHPKAVERCAQSTLHSEVSPYTSWGLGACPAHRGAAPHPPQVDEAFLSTHGLRKGDALPLPLEDFETVLRAAASGGPGGVGPGGVAGNTIKALGRLGNANTAMVGMAGDDQVRVRSDCVAP